MSHRDDRQDIVAKWCAAAFGVEQAKSYPQRGLRLLEEATEAAQAAGVLLEKALHVINYVYGRPGGVTLLALADAADLSADEEEGREVLRVTSLPLEHFAKRNREKNEAGLVAENLKCTACHGLGMWAGSGHAEHDEVIRRTEERCRAEHAAYPDALKVAMDEAQKQKARAVKAEAALAAFEKARGT